MRLFSLLFLGPFYAALAFGAPLSLEGIESREIQKPFTSVEDFLAWASQEDPEYFSSFTLVRYSQSMQDSSPENPRAIVFGSEAKLILSFNGSPEQEGFQRVEFIEFQPKSHSYHFRFLEFRGGSSNLSPVNPESCAQCHTERYRPIWDDYDRWPTAYGAFDDSIIDFHGFGSEGERGKYFKDQSEQFDQFMAFRSKFDAHPRYGFLKPLPGEVSPYSPREKGVEASLRPNAYLTALLVRQQAERLVSLMESHPGFPAKRAELLSALLGCEKVKGEWLAQPILQSFGIEKADWNLSLFPQRWGYFEGARNLSDFVATTLYYRSQKALGLTPFRPVKELGFSEPLFFETPDIAYSQAPLAVQVKRACDLLSEVSP